MFTTTTTQEPQKAHARYISTVGMLATIYDKDNPDQTLVLGAGKTLALLNIQDGVVKAEYQTDAIIQAIAIDTVHQRVIAATRNGVFYIHL